MSIFGEIAGDLFGDSSSSSTVNSTVNVDIQGLNNIGVNETIDLQPVTVTLNENVDVQPVTVTLNENVDLKPVTLNENIDLKPVAVDTCQTLRLAPLPETRVSNPYHHRVTYHLFGIEMVNVTYTGESGQNIESPRHPQVVEGQRLIGGHRDEHSMIVSEGQGIRVRVLHPDEE
jgi:hypothetical protein